MTRPIVSVIVTAYNRERFIGAAIASIQRQTLTDLELIVVDDGSTDGTCAMVESFRDPGIRLLRHSANRGIPAARNSGLEAARGGYVAWLDSDDTSRPHRLERQVGFLDKHPEVALVGACAGKIDAAGRRFGKLRLPPFDAEDVRAWLLFRSAFQHSSTMGRAAVLKRFPFDSDFPVCEDIDLFIRLADRHLLVNLPEVLIDRRLHEGQSVETRRDAIRAKKAALQSALLRQIGVRFDAGDLERHVRLGSGGSEQVGVDGAFLDWADDWLQRVVAANDVSKAFDYRTLRFACAYFWAAAVRRAARKQGFAATARRLYSSPISRGLLTRHSAEWAAKAASALARSSWSR